MQTLPVASSPLIIEFQPPFSKSVWQYAKMLLAGAILAEKLLQIRKALDLSQDDMVRGLGMVGEIDRNYVSKFERGTHEPNLLILLQYARVAGVCVDLLIDDQQDLPARLPTTSVHRRGAKWE